MSTNRQLLTNSEAQEKMAAEHSAAKSQYKDAMSAAIEAEKAADAKYRSAKKQVPQDIKGMEEAKAEKAKAKSDKEAAKKIMSDYHEKEKAFNNSQVSRVANGETKQDTIDKPTDTEDFSKTKEPDAGANTGSEPDAKGATNSAGQSGGTGGDKQNAGGKAGGKGLQLGQGFYDAVAGAIKPGVKGNALDAASATAKEQAQNYRNRSAQNQMEAQRAQQIANQNPYAEAGKIASVQNDAENRQTINNTSFAAGTAAARLRKTNAPDVQAQMQREDQQQNVANQRREEANTAQEENTAAEGDSKTFAIKSRDLSNDTAEESNLSMGTPEQGEPEAEKTEEPAQTPETAGTSWQNVMNYLTYGNDPTSGWNKGTKPGYQEAKAYAEQKGWAPIQASQEEFDGDLGHLQELVKAQQPGFYEEWQSGSGRVGASGEQINRGDAGDEVIDKAQTPSDERIKNITACLSDARCKRIKASLDTGNELSSEDFMWLAAHTGGKFSHNDRDYNFFNDDDWADDSDGSVLDGYAAFIKNYVYTYKPEATQIDSRIDPNEEHIGPMAQDIEKVNPACIKETPEGVKTVDTARLAMMNAGAIGDLARQFQDLTDKLKAIGVE